VLMRVFCCLGVFGVHLHPKFMRVHLRVRTHTLKTDTGKVPRLATPLTDIQPRTAKPKAKPYKLADGGGPVFAD